MLPRLILPAAVFLLAALFISPAIAQSQPNIDRVSRAATTTPEPCRTFFHGKSSYIICELDLRQHVVRTYWKRPNGKGYDTIWGLVRAMKTEGKRPLFAMNAGMFKEDRSPLGLYVEDGKELVGADTGGGEGNFYMKPNGILFIAGDRAGVVETGRFSREKPKVDFATQSEPMLVIDGALHPAISPRGTSRHVRNGVGVRDAHTVVFAISKLPVTFGELALLFKDRLAVPNALYLDGTVSAVYTTKTPAKRYFLPIGPMLGAHARPQ